MANGILVKEDVTKLTLNKVLMFFTLWMSIFLNHSNSDFGANISLADFFILFVILFLFAGGEFIIPVPYFLFFIALSVSLLTVSIVYVPFKFNIPTNYFSIAVDYLKLLVSFLFFLTGYHLSRLGQMKKSIRWYAFGAFAIGLVGLVFNILNIDFLNELIYYAESRYRGLMIDPNYYAVVQMASFPYFFRSERYTSRQKTLFYLFTLIFVLMSASKTGMIIFSIYSIFLFIEQTYYKKRTLHSSLRTVNFWTLLFILVPLLTNIFLYLKGEIIELFPLSERVFSLLDDFGATINESGSGRSDVWAHGIEMIKMTPLWGVGVGTYSLIGEALFNSNSVAHNTYIQILAEWGGILGLFFFGYILKILSKVTLRRKEKRADNISLMLRDMLFIFLLGSLGISLNNARMFWLFLGALVYYSEVGSRHLLAKKQEN